MEKVKNWMGQQNVQTIFKSKTKKCFDKYNQIYLKSYPQYDQI